MTSAIFSDADQLQQISRILFNYLRLPFSDDVIPGALLEATLAKVRQAEVLRTYDFADVISRADKIGWQVKSTQSTTPVTWMRAKIANRNELISASENSAAGCIQLGAAILDYCNSHARHSLEKYVLEQIIYARLIRFPAGKIVYFERPLISTQQPVLFAPDDYEWDWSKPRTSVGKEQLPAFVGRHKQTGDKHFAWHGRGENQLHFSGERLWWLPPDSPHRIDFVCPADNQRVDFETLADWLARLD